VSLADVLKIDNLITFANLVKLQLDNNLIERIGNLDNLVSLQWLSTCTLIGAEQVAGIPMAKGCVASYNRPPRLPAAARYTCCLLTYILAFCLSLATHHTSGYASAKGPSSILLHLLAVTFSMAMSNSLA